MSVRRTGIVSTLACHVAVAYGTTTEETTRPDGTRVVVHRVVEFALGPQRTLIGAALLLLGSLLCVAAIWLAGQRKGFKPTAATELAIKASDKFELKAYFGFPGFVLVVGALLALAGVAVFVFQKSYSAII